MPVFFLIAILVFSCEEEKSHEEVTFRIKENRASCTGFFEMECYLIQQGAKINTDEWEYFYNEIEGFAYEPGFVYKILVAKIPVKDPPMDASAFRYLFLQEISRDPK